MSDSAELSPIVDTHPPAASSRPARNWIDLDTNFTRWLARWRWWFFAGLAILILTPFNGQWRIGLDSSIYRGVADNVIAGKGYVFAGLPQKQIYPGLPFLLVSLQKITGTTGVLPVLVVMNLCALLSVWATYLLIKTRYPIWIAVTVACGAAMNVKFVQQAQEVMTDMPFLLGCLLAMLGWEKLAPDQPDRRPWRAASLLLAGLFLSAVMRPTFWVLALALIVACLWNIVRHRERRSLIALGALMLVGLAFAALDPRVRGLNILQGGYERELLGLAGDLGSRALANAPRLFGTEIIEAFFNEPPWRLSIPLVVLLMGGTVLVTRRQPLWGLQVFILTGIMLVLSDAPRYYLMVLPTLWLGYVLALLRLTSRLPDLWRNWSLFAMFSLANFLNLSGVVALLYEQHRRDFVSHYRSGSYVRLIAMAKVIRDRVPENAIVVGPYANLLTYLSGRNVLSGRLMGFDVAGMTRYPALAAAHRPTYLVGPSTEYREKDPALARLIEHGVLKPTKYIDKVTSPRGTMWLTQMDVIVPDGDWRKMPTTRPVVLATRPPRPTTRRVLTPEQVANRELKARRARKELRAYRERKARKLRKQQQQQRLRQQSPATQPATTPSTSSRLIVPLEQLGAMWLDKQWAVSSGEWSVISGQWSENTLCIH